MIKLRKFLAVIYFIAYVVLVGGWACVWFKIEPIASTVQSAYGDYRLDYFVLACMVITLIGVLITLGRTLSVRSKNAFQSSKNELGFVQVSRGAIVHEVENTVEAHEELKLLRTNVTIKNRRNPTAEISVRIAPRASLPMPEVASSLQREIKEAVEHLTGNRVKSVVVDIRKAMEAKEAVQEEEEESSLFSGFRNKRKKEDSAGEAQAAESEQDVQDAADLPEQDAQDAAALPEEADQGETDQSEDEAQVQE